MYSHLISLIVPVSQSHAEQYNTPKHTDVHASKTVLYINTLSLSGAKKKTKKQTNNKSSQYYLRYKMWCVFTLQLGRLGCSHAWFSDDSYFWEGSVLTWNRDIWPWLLFSPWGHKNCDVPVASLKEVVNCQLNSATWKNFLVSMT